MDSIAFHFRHAFQGSSYDMLVHDYFKAICSASR
ncbi:unnamed protein product [Choristocarpus tenellus]